jgi:hypothetical protein
MISRGTMFRFPRDVTGGDAIMNESDKKTDQNPFDKRLKRIERWLKRCVEACRCGAWAEAIMEIGCMEAETREFREELWEKAECEAARIPQRSLKKTLFCCMKVAALSAVFVLSAGLPLSTEQDRAFYGFQPDSIALLTSTESDILNALRETLSNRNTGTVILSIELPESIEPPVPRSLGAAAAETEMPARRAPAVRIAETAGTAPPEATPAPEPKEQEGPTVEEVLSLIQIGQRALRASEPAVTIMPVLTNQGTAD